MHRDEVTGLALFSTAALLIALAAAVTSIVWRHGWPSVGAWRQSPRYAGRMLRRIVVAIIGSTVLLVGMAFLVLPGPAFLVLPAGLAILATEFAWAKQLLRRARRALPRLGGRHQEGGHPDGEVARDGEQHSRGVGEGGASVRRQGWVERRGNFVPGSGDA